MRFYQYFLLLLVFCINHAFGQPKNLKIFGTVYNEENEPLNLVTVNVYTDSNRIIIQRTNQKGEFEFTLDYGKNYVVEFSKAKHYAKTVNVLAKNVSFSDISEAQKYGAWEVELYEQIKGVDVSVLDHAVGEIFFDKNTGYFDWSAEYAETIKADMEKLKEDLAIARQQYLEDRAAQKYTNFTKNAKPAESLILTSPSKLEIYDSLLIDAYLRFPKQVTEEIVQYETYRVTKRFVEWHNGYTNTYRKVEHYWGGKYYFKDGVNISRILFELETRTKEDFENKQEDETIIKTTRN